MWCSDGYGLVGEHEMRSDWRMRKSEADGRLRFAGGGRVAVKAGVV